MLAASLALPVALLCRRIFNEGYWPENWRLHWIIPLFKKGNVYDPEKYRGIHLSSILSKTVERVVGNPLITFLQNHVYGDEQWAFRKNCEARDVVTLSLAMWVLQICREFKIGIYLADISGAFDKVSRVLLLARLEECGVPSQYLDFLNSYLLNRKGVVLVEGSQADPIVLTNMVFQGTVLGPSLWNSFFSDIGKHVVEGNQEAQIFADDLKVTASYAVHVSPNVIVSDLENVQQRAHDWGRRHRVTFDPSKESFHIIHPLFDDESSFKLLGTLLDSALSMKPLVDALLVKIRPKVRAIVRMKHMFSLRELLDQFKMQAWSHLEYHNGALILAKSVDKERIDKMQRNFLHQLECSECEAFVEHNFAPPSLRRAIAILGFLHKRVLGICHPALIKALPYDPDMSFRYHGKTLAANFDQVRAYPALYRNSLWDYIHIYNRFPPGLIEVKIVKTFQSKLMQIAKTRASLNDPDWRKAFQSCGDVLRHCHGNAR